jgi:phosphate transport system protein
MSLKIARHLERVGDYAKNMARRTRTIAKAEAFTGSVSTMVRMSELVQNMIRSALDAYSKRDSVLADEVRDSDESVDQMHNTLFRELLTYMMEDADNVAGSIHLLLIAKNLERMGDHVADIAKETIYMITGEWPQNRRNKDDHTSKMIVELSDD